MVQNTHSWIILPKERGSLGIYVPTPENNWVQADPGGCQFSSTSSLSQVRKRYWLMHFWKRTFQQAVGSWQKSTNMIRSEENGWENDPVCYKKKKVLEFAFHNLVFNHLTLIFVFCVIFGTNCIGFYGFHFFPFPFPSFFAPFFLCSFLFSNK